MHLHYIIGLAFSLSLLTSIGTHAEESGFLSSYEGLGFAEGEYGGKTLPAPRVTDKMAAITKIMVDQPESFIAADSPYKGMKPDDALTLSEALRSAVLANMKEGSVVDEPGEDVLYLRLAISEIHMKKKKRRLVSYTPVGLVAHAAKGLAVSDIMKKLDLTGVTIEMESMNSSSGEHLGFLVIKLAPSEEGDSDSASWDAMMANFDAIGQQISCRLRNSKVAEAERENCKILESYQEG